MLRPGNLLGQSDLGTGKKKGGEQTCYTGKQDSEFWINTWLLFLKSTRWYKERKEYTESCMAREVGVENSNVSWVLLWVISVWVSHLSTVFQLQGFPKSEIPAVASKFRGTLASHLASYNLFSRKQSFFLSLRLTVLCPFTGHFQFSQDMFNFSGCYLFGRLLLNQISLGNWRFYVLKLTLNKCPLLLHGTWRHPLAVVLPLWGVLYVDTAPQL